MKCCLVIPHYKHEKLFAEFLPKLLTLNMPCIVVDDDSGDTSLSQLEALLAPFPDVHLVKHQSNRGKGAAVVTGLYHASAMGFTHMLQLDADGQHNIDDASILLRFSKAYPHAFVCGEPYFDESAPKIRVYGRKITDLVAALETFSFKIKDALCGFRVYPIKELERILDRHYVGPRMDFDPELLVKAVWEGIDLKFVPTKVIYHEDGVAVSHFNYLRDNLMMIKLHIRLIIGVLIRLPYIAFQRLKCTLK